MLYEYSAPRIGFIVVDPVLSRYSSVVAADPEPGVRGIRNRGCDAAATATRRLHKSQPSKKAGIYFCGYYSTGNKQCSGYNTKMHMN